MDNTDSGFNASAGGTTAAAISGFVGSNYLTFPAGSGANTASWNPGLPSQKQRYDVYANWVADASNATNATYTILQANG